MSVSFTLPARLGTSAARALAETLWKEVSAEADLLLDGRHVEQVGQACLQVLVSARKTALNREVGFRIVDASPALIEGCTLVGLNDLLDQ